jgi:hypothetical protein
MSKSAVLQSQISKTSVPWPEKEEKRSGWYACRIIFDVNGSVKSVRPCVAMHVVATFDRPEARRIGCVEVSKTRWLRGLPAEFREASTESSTYWPQPPAWTHVAVKYEPEPVPAETHTDISKDNSAAIAASVDELPAPA